MSQAAERGTHCGCSVEWNPFAAPYYLAVVPFVFVAALWMLNSAAARGMAAVVIILATTLLIPGLLVGRMYSAGIRIPNVLAMMAIPWPQFIFFGPAMFWAEPRSGPVLPHEWALLITLAFWLAAAFVFGLLARRVKSLVVLSATAIGFVVGTALAVWIVAPLFNWKMVMESL